MSTAHDTTVSDPAIEAAIAKATAHAQAACDSWLAAEAEEMQAEEQLFKSMMEESAGDNWKKFLTHSTPSPDIAKPQP